MRVLIIFGAMSASTAYAQWGNLNGRFVYDGQPPVQQVAPKPPNGERLPIRVPHEDLLVDPATHGVSNILIYLRTRQIKIHPSYEASAKADISLAAKNFRFEPHLVLLRTGQTLVLENLDKVDHSFNLIAPGEHATRGVLKPAHKKNETYQLSWSVPTAVVSEMYPWMKGYVICRDNPYLAATKPDGSFEIKLIPAGEHQIQLWHEDAGPLVAKPQWDKGRVTVTIKSGETTDLGEIKLDPRLFVN